MRQVERYGQHAGGIAAYVAGDAGAVDGLALEGPAIGKAGEIEGLAVDLAKEVDGADIALLRGALHIVQFTTALAQAFDQLRAPRLQCRAIGQ